MSPLDCASLEVTKMKQFMIKTGGPKKTVILFLKPMVFLLT